MEQEVSNTESTYQLKKTPRKEIVGLLVRLVNNGEAASTGTGVDESGTQFDTVNNGAEDTETDGDFEFIPAEELDQPYTIEEDEQLGDKPSGEASNEDILSNEDDIVDNEVAAEVAEFAADDVAAIGGEYGVAGEVLTSSLSEPSSVVEEEVVENANKTLETSSTDLSKYNGIAGAMCVICLIIEISAAVYGSDLSQENIQKYSIYAVVHLVAPFLLGLFFGKCCNSEFVFGFAVSRYALHYLLKDVFAGKGAYALSDYANRMIDTTSIVSILMAFWERQAQSLNAST